MDQVGEITRNWSPKSGKLPAALGQRLPLAESGRQQRLPGMWGAVREGAATWGDTTPA